MRRSRLASGASALRTASSSRHRLSVGGAALVLDMPVGIIQCLLTLFVVAALLGSSLRTFRHVTVPASLRQSQPKRKRVETSATAWSQADRSQSARTTSSRHKAAVWRPPSIRVGTETALLAVGSVRRALRRRCRLPIERGPALVPRSTFFPLFRAHSFGHMNSAKLCILAYTSACKKLSSLRISGGIGETVWDVESAGS
jgi:hypothetical protein